MIRDDRTMQQVLQEELDRNKAMLKDKLASPMAYYKSVAVLINRDIEFAEKAIEENNTTDMFRALRALRENIYSVK